MRVGSAGNLLMNFTFFSFGTKLVDKYVVVISQKTNKKNEVIGPSDYSKEYLDWRKRQTLELSWFYYWSGLCNSEAEPASRNFSTF